jgi:hypothetical protein
MSRNWRCHHMVECQCPADSSVNESTSERELRRNKNKMRHARMLPLCVLS